MDSERLIQIEKIYHGVLEIPYEKRGSFIDESCGSDAELRREVESLLSFEKTFDNFIDSPPAALITEFFSGQEKELSFSKEKIGHYNIKKLLGKGGMGEVFLAEDTKLNRQVALKILPQEFAEETERMNRFIREAKSASALNHPNIITIHEIGKEDDIHFIATEYIEGETLYQLLQENTLSQTAKLEIAIQIASALDAAHRAGIIHRDIKPENIMLRPDGLVKILDFGVAKLASDFGFGNIEDEVEKENPELQNSKSEATSPGIIIGTPNYMSPEQARGKVVDGRSDIFSFGIVLYEMLTLKKAFSGNNALEVIDAILNKEPLPITQLLTELPPRIENIVNKTLSKNQEKRYQTAQDLVLDLKNAKQDLEFQDKLERASTPTSDNLKTQIVNFATADVSPLPTSRIEFISQEIKKHKYSFATILLLISIAASFGYWLFSNRAAPSRQIESIAVMPFINENGNQDAEYLSDGMTETLISNLSQVPNLSVKARSSVFRYKGRATNAQTIGKELNVQAVLNTRVIQRGDQIILNLELVDALTENVIWSHQYDSKQTDLISLQSEIAHDVSSKLKSKLSVAEEAKVTKSSTIDPDAYQAYLKGRYFWNRRTDENLRKAIEQFKFATERDPNYALAYSGLADCYGILSEYTGLPTSETIPQAKAYAERAVAIDDQLAEPLVSLAQVNQRLWQWAESQREFKRAIELNPNYATAYHWYSLLLRDLGRYDEAAAMIKRAHEIDPLSNIISINVSQVYQAQNDYQSSMENTLKVIELDPSYVGAYGNLALSYLHIGRRDEALKNFEKAVEMSKRADGALRNLGYAYGVIGKRVEALAIAKELEEKFARKESLGEFVATVYAGLGDKDKAFEWLEKDFQNKENLGSIRGAPQFQILHDDPRYHQLLKRMNLPE